jgi:SAM-dependent methyltransferase
MLQAFSSMTDQQWLDILVESVRQPVINGIKLPGFPPDTYQRESVGSAGKQTLKEAYDFYCEIKRSAERLGLKLNADSRILDFGCGWGRIIRFFLKDVRAENLFGVDVDPLMIDYCRQLVGYGNYSVVNSQPPTEFANESLDVIYAYSVFSHLSEPVHIKWVEEFSRILKPGGLLVATTEARHFIEYCLSLRGKKHETKWHETLANAFPDTEATLADYDCGRFIFSATGGGDPRPSTFYGEAVIPRAYVEREWTKYLSFKDFISDQNRFWQAVIIMQKLLSDVNLPLETRKGLEKTIKEKDRYISNLKSLLNEKEAALNRIYVSRGWKALQIYYKVRDKILSR